MKRRLLWIKALLITLAVTVTAQVSNCPAIVEQALQAVGDNCGDLGRNSACYGYDRVDATFVIDQGADFFSTPADRAALLELETIRTAPLDVEQNRWGVAVMNLMANLPNTVPGQGVLVMLVGDSEITNNVNPDDATVPVDPIPILTNAETNLYTAPSSTANVRETVPSETTLMADGFNPSQNWLRVVYEGDIVWVEATNLADTPGITLLPTVGASRPTPMQAFTFSTGVGQPECQEADPMIAVQSPDNLVVDLTVNGVDIRVGSLVTFTGGNNPNEIILTVHRGSVQTIFGNTITQGNSSTGILGNNGNIMSWSSSSSSTQQQQQQGQMAQQGFNNVSQANNWQTLDILDTNSSENNNGNTNDGNPIVLDDGTLIHVVQPGDTLFSIARRYDASMPAIVQVNNLASAQVISVGQRLIIPNPGSGFVGLPTTTTTTTDTSDTPPDDPVCGGFRITSPTDGAPIETTTYYWDPAPGAEFYQVNFFGESGSTANLFVDAPATSSVVSIQQYGLGQRFSWEVIAFANDVPICNSGRVSLQAPSAGPPPPPPPLVASYDCIFTSLYELTINWSGAGPNDEVTAFALDTYNGSFSFTDMGPSGSIKFTSLYSFYFAQVTNESTGEIIGLFTSVIPC